MAALSVALFATSGANAAGSASDKAAAEALFDEGVRLLKAGSYPEACQKLEASQKADPGIGTLLYLGECYERQGKTASAWATFREAASMAEAAGQADRAKKGMARADRLTSSLSRLTIQIDPAQRNLPGLEVRRGEELVSASLVGTAVPVDPGNYRVVVSAPGYESREASVTVEGQAASAQLEIPPLTKLPEEEKPAIVASEPKNVEPAEAKEPEKPGQTQRTIGLVTGGVGVVGLGVGAVFGILAISSNGSSDCSGTICLTPEGQQAAEDARSQAQIADIAFIAGGALLATGAVIYFTAPSAPSETGLWLRTRGSRFELGGSF